MAVSPATLEYLKWYEVLIIFDRSDHSDFVPKPGLYPLIVSPIIKGVKLNQVIVDGGSSLNILFLKTFNQIGVSRAALHPSRAPYHRIVLGAVTTPVGQITFPMTFRTRENFHTKHLQFEVADFRMAYNTFLRRSAPTKFTSIPHYAYLVLKMPGPHNIISIRGDVKRIYNYDKESYKTTDKSTHSIRGAPRVEECLGRVPPDSIMTEAKTSKTSIQPED
jgi:hypothetical protein